VLGQWLKSGVAWLTVSHHHSTHHVAPSRMPTQAEFITQMLE